jgi:hypothetical protein
MVRRINHSHSIVAGDLEEKSQVTRSATASG